MKRWRLGIDIGTNSIGYACLRLRPEGKRYMPDDLASMGVRIFSDGRNPKDGQSLAAMRRKPRGMRRTRDRALNRNARYLEDLRKFGLLPVGDAECLLSENPYVLRSRGLDEKLEIHELGRALWHLKRRGFRSNRKTDAGAEESGKIRDAARRTEQELAASGCRTIGEWLARPIIEVIEANRSLPSGQRKPLPQARVRLHGSGAKAFYDFYPTRDMILQEFDTLWASQRRWDADLLTDEAYQ